jgi:hypothetical protein
MNSVDIWQGRCGLFMPGARHHYKVMMPLALAQHKDKQNLLTSHCKRRVKVECLDQGDQNGRIYAHWAVIYLRQFFNYCSSPILKAYIFPP